MLGGWGGLARIGWELPAALPLLVDHGSLLVSGFVATLIALERVVVARRPLAVLIPAVSAAGAVASLAGVPAPIPALLTVASGLGLAALLASGARILPGLSVATMTAGALCWAVGALEWLVRGSVASAVPWWTAFVVLVIAAERLELSRALRPSGIAVASFAGALVVVAAGLAVSVGDPHVGSRVVGAGCVALAVWLLARDTPPRGARMVGLVRFIRLATVSAYVWLLIGGGLLALFGAEGAGVHRDAALHAVFVGFVFAMIFAHGPIVLPAVLGTAFRVPALDLRAARAPARLARGSSCRRPRGATRCSNVGRAPERGRGAGVLRQHGGEHRASSDELRKSTALNCPACAGGGHGWKGPSGPPRGMVRSVG